MLTLCSEFGSCEARQGGRHGQGVVASGALGTDRACVSTRASKAQRWSTEDCQSGLLARNSVCAQDRLSLGVFAAGAWLWQRDDLLATAPRLAGSRHLEQDLARAIGLSWPSGSDRLGLCRDGQLHGACRFRGVETGPNPTDRGKTGSKRHLLTDGRGTPLTISHTAAGRHDSQKAMQLVDAVPPIKQPRGRPRQRPDELFGDRAYDAEQKIRRPLRKRGIQPQIARRYEDHGSGLGKYRYVVEACFAWLFNWRRLRVRYEKRDDIHQPFLNLGCIMICWNRVRQFC